jgi:hypothetical protein
MRRTFILRSEHGFVVAETIVIDSKSLSFNPSILEEFRGKEGEEMYYKSYALTAVDAEKPKYVTWVCNAEWEVRKVSDFGIMPRKWWQIWRKK